MESLHSEKNTVLGPSKFRSEFDHCKYSVPKQASYDELGELLDDGSSCRSFQTSTSDELEKILSDDMASNQSSRRYPSIPKIKTYEEYDSDAENKFKISNVPKPPRIAPTNQKGKALSKKDFKKEKSMNAKVTVPKAPRLATMEKNGQRSYSCVTPTKEIVNEVDKWKDRKLTVPVPPRLETLAKFGEKVYSCVTQEKEIVETVDKWKDRQLTIPNPPKLSLLAKNGEKAYSCSSKEDSSFPSIDSISTSCSSEKKPTVPQAPKLMTLAKYGERCYSSVADSSPMRGTNTDYPAWTECKDKLIEKGALRESSYLSTMQPGSGEKKPTVPQSPKLITLAKYGERCYSSVADSSPMRGTHTDYPAWTEYKEKLIEQGALRENSSSDKPLRLTIPAPFDLSEPTPKATDATAQEVSTKHEFKALPLPDFSFDPSQPLSEKESVVTVPEPFHLSSDAKDRSRTRSSSPASQEAPSFKARPMPNFNVRSQSPLPKARSPTKLAPFKFHSSELDNEQNGQSKDASALRTKQPLRGKSLLVLEKETNSEVHMDALPPTPKAGITMPKAKSTPKSKSRIFTPPGAKITTPKTKSAPKSRRSPSTEKRNSKSVTKSRQASSRGRSSASRGRSVTPRGRSSTPRSRKAIEPYQFKAKKMPDFSKPFKPKLVPRQPSPQVVRILPETHQFKARKMPDFSKPFTPNKKRQEQRSKEAYLKKAIAQHKEKLSQIEKVPTSNMPPENPIVSPQKTERVSLGSDYKNKKLEQNSLMFQSAVESTRSQSSSKSESGIRHLANSRDLKESLNSHIKSEDKPNSPPNDLRLGLNESKIHGFDTKGSAQAYQERKHYGSDKISNEVVSHKKEIRQEDRDEEIRSSDVKTINASVQSENVQRGGAFMFDMKDMERIGPNSAIDVNKNYHESDSEVDRDPLLLVMERLNQSLDKFKAYEKSKIEMNAHDAGMSGKNVEKVDTKHIAKDNESTDPIQAKSDKGMESQLFDLHIGSSCDEEESYKKKDLLSDALASKKQNLFDLSVNDSSSIDAFENKSSCSGYINTISLNQLQPQAEDEISIPENESGRNLSCHSHSLNGIASTALPDSHLETQNNNGDDFEVSAKTNLFHGGWQMAPEQEATAKRKLQLSITTNQNTNVDVIQHRNNDLKVLSPVKLGRLLEIADDETRNHIEEINEMMNALTPKHDNKGVMNELHDDQVKLGTSNKDEKLQQHRQQIDSLFNPSSGDSTYDTDTDTDDDNTDTMTGSSSSEMHSLTVIPERPGDYELLSHGTLSTEMLPRQLSLETTSEITERGMKLMEKSLGSKLPGKYMDDFDQSIDKKIHDMKRGKQKSGIGKFFDGQKFIYKFCCASSSTAREPSPSTTRFLDDSSRDEQ